MQILIIPLAKRSFYWYNFEQTAAVHRYRGNRAVSPTIPKQNNTANEYLQNKNHLINRRILDNKENIIIQIS